MARIRIEIPERFIAKVEVPVRITDINYGNHVGNDAFVAMVHEARVQWLQKHGYTELSIEGIGLIMSDLAVEFKNESVYGDIATINISVGEISKLGFELYYQLKTTRNNESVILANAKTGMICYDYTARKIAPIPEKLKAILDT